MKINIKLYKFESENCLENIRALCKIKKHITICMGKKVMLPAKIYKDGNLYKIEARDTDKSSELSFDIEYSTKNNECQAHINHFAKTEKYSGTTIIKTILGFLRLVGFKTLTLQDVAIIKGPDKKYFSLTKSTLLVYGEGFYERYGFTAEVPTNNHHTFNGRRYEISVPELKKFAKRISKKKACCFFKKIKSFVERIQDDELILLPEFDIKHLGEKINSDAIKSLIDDIIILCNKFLTLKSQTTICNILDRTSSKKHIPDPPAKRVDIFTIFRHIQTLFIILPFISDRKGDIIRNYYCELIVGFETNAIMLNHMVKKFKPIKIDIGQNPYKFGSNDCAINVKWLYDKSFTDEIIVGTANKWIPVTVVIGSGKYNKNKYYIKGARDLISNTKVYRPFEVECDIAPGSGCRAHLASFGKTQKLSGTEVMKILLEFIRLLGFKELTLTDAAEKVCENPKESFIFTWMTLLLNDACFYDKYKFVRLKNIISDRRYNGKNIPCDNMDQIIKSLRGAKVNTLATELLSFSEGIQKGDILLSRSRKGASLGLNAKIDAMKFTAAIIESCKKVLKDVPTGTVFDAVKVLSENRTDKSCVKMSNLFNIFSHVHDLFSLRIRATNKNSKNLVDCPFGILIHSFIYSAGETCGDMSMTFD